ncbi:MAG: MarR family winged helix-turn-helix transcriptional regulator [Chloroflexota bacterium]
MTAIDERECAGLLMEVVPLVMRTIRTEMRKGRGPRTTVPQFRALAFIGRHPEAPLLRVAEHLGLTPASTSRIVEGLVADGLVERKDSPEDRRRLTLKLTEQGQATLAATRESAQARLAEMLRPLGPAERETVAEAMRALLPLFAAGTPRATTEDSA